MTPHRMRVILMNNPALRLFDHKQHYVKVIGALIRGILCTQLV